MADDCFRYLLRYQPPDPMAELREMFEATSARLSAAEQALRAVRAEGTPYEHTPRCDCAACAYLREA